MFEVFRPTTLVLPLKKNIFDNLLASNKMKSPSRRSANCLFGVKKNGSCARKVGRKSSRAISRNKKARSVRRAHKSRPRGSTPCLFGVKKNGACSRKVGRKSKSAIRRNRRSRSVRHASTPARAKGSGRTKSERSHARKVAVKKSRAPAKRSHARKSASKRKHSNKSSRALTIVSTQSCRLPTDANCLFGRKKNGACAMKVGRRSKSASRRNARSRALRHAPKARPRGSTPCLFGVKLNGACARKTGAKSKSAKRRNSHARMMRRLPVCGRGMSTSHPEPSLSKSKASVKGVILSTNKKEVVALLTHEGKVEAVEPFAAPAIMPPELPVVKVQPEVMAEIAKVEVVGEQVGHVKPASTGHVAAMIEIFDENLIKCRERGGTWDAKGKKCIEKQEESSAVVEQVVLSTDQKQIVAVVDEDGDLKKLAHPIEAPAAVPEAAQAHPSPADMKKAEVIATPNISEILKAVRDCQESGGKWDKKKNECYSFHPDTGARVSHAEGLKAQIDSAHREKSCRESGGRWENGECLPALVVLSEDKQEVIAIVSEEGKVQALAEPIPTPPALPPAAIAHPPAAIMREIAKVEETGVATKNVTLAPMSMAEVLAAVRTCQESGGKWDKKAQKCVMEKVILNADKTEIIGVQEQSGAVAALAVPISLPPNAPPPPPFMVAHVPVSVVKQIEKVEDTGVPSANVAIVATPAGGRSGLLDAIQKGTKLRKVTCASGEEWKDGRCVKTSSGGLLGEIRGGVKLRKASDRGSSQSSDSGRSSPEMERLLARRGRIAPEEDEDWE